MATSWADLDRELAAWDEAGRTATFWWRDDDATAPTPALDRLLRLAEAAAVPVALAVIPAGAEPALAAALRERPGATVLQHGYTHRNHAPPDVKKAELGPHRPRSDIAAELVRGRDRLRALFGARFRPVLVPPWNRIDPELAGTLPRLGFVALSTYGGSAKPFAASGMAIVDTHIDIIDWKADRGFLGEARALDLAVRHLAARRRGAVARGEPTGLLTHHHVHDSGAWAFIERFLARVGAHRAARWPDAAALFAPRGPDAPAAPEFQERIR
jgi:peptidoglycan/xylan/chitin deacetylase (PgdA/CDA1 family)